MKSVFFFFLFCAGGTFKVNPELMEKEGQAQVVPKAKATMGDRAGPALRLLHTWTQGAPPGASPRAGISDLLHLPQVPHFSSPPRLGHTAGPEPRRADVPAGVSPSSLSEGPI